MRLAGLQLDALARDGSRATGTPAASVRAGLERRVGDRERDAARARPRRSPSTEPRPSRSPWWCISRIDAVPGSRGPAKVPIVPWQRDRVHAAAGRRRSARASRRSTPRRRSPISSGSSPSSRSISAAVRRRPAARSRRPGRARSRSRIRSNTSPNSAMPAMSRVGEALLAQVGGRPCAPSMNAGVGAAVVERAPEVRVGRGHPVAVALELELGDHDGSSRPTTYAHGLMTKRSSANGRSSVHAPPSWSRRSSTSTPLPARAR